MDGWKLSVEHLTPPGAHSVLHSFGVGKTGTHAISETHNALLLDCQGQVCTSAIRSQYLISKKHDTALENWANIYKPWKLLWHYNVLQQMLRYYAPKMAIVTSFELHQFKCCLRVYRHNSEFFPTQWGINLSIHFRIWKLVWLEIPSSSWSWMGRAFRSFQPCHRDAGSCLQQLASPDNWNGKTKQFHF